MEFIGSGVRRGNEKGGNSPTPAPTGAASANGTVEQQEKHKVLREMRALADEMVDDRELSRR